MGPRCTRYKPKYEMLQKKTTTLDMEKHSRQPNHIEDIILNCYKKFQNEYTLGIYQKCKPLARHENRVREIYQLAEASEQQRMKPWTDFYQRGATISDTHYLKGKQFKTQKMDRVQKFYELILSDINKYSNDFKEKEMLIERLNAYLSMKTENIEDIHAIVKNILSNTSKKALLNLNTSATESSLVNNTQPDRMVLPQEPQPLTATPSTNRKMVKAKMKKCFTSKYNTVKPKEGSLIQATNTMAETNNQSVIEH